MEPTKSLLIAFLAFLSACGQAPKTIPPDFVPYIDKFLTLSDQYHLSLSADALDISFGPMGDPEQIGYCQYTYGPIIRIDKEFWDTANDASREALIFHELGHCLLHRWVHREDLDAKGQPLSLMYPDILDDSLYANNRGYFIQELFTHE